MGDHIKKDKSVTDKPFFGSYGHCTPVTRLNGQL